VCAMCRRAAVLGREHLNVALRVEANRRRLRVTTSSRTTLADSSGVFRAHHEKCGSAAPHTLGTLAVRMRCALRTIRLYPL